MDGQMLILALLIIIAVVLLMQRKDKIESDNNNSSEKNEPIIEMEDIFYEKVQSGSVPYKLLNIYDQYDLIFLKSLFQSEQIPYHTEFENMSRLKPGIQIKNYNGTFFYVLDEDYEDSIKVIDSYISNKSNVSTIKTKVRNIAEIAIAGWYVQPNSISNITVFRRNR